MEKLVYTWDEQLSDTDDICDQIEKDKFLPDVIVGISRGGLIPGVMISHKLNIPLSPFMHPQEIFHTGRIICQKQMILRF